MSKIKKFETGVCSFLIFHRLIPSEADLCLSLFKTESLYISLPMCCLRSTKSFQEALLSVFIPRPFLFVGWLGFRGDEALSPFVCSFPPPPLILNSSSGGSFFSCLQQLSHFLRRLKQKKSPPTTAILKQISHTFLMLFFVFQKDSGQAGDGYEEGVGIKYK